MRNCQHTGWASNQESAWWQIEYDHPVLVHSVDLYNRVEDCCGERLSNVNIYVFKDGVDGTRQYCGTTDANMKSKRYIKITCPQALEGNIIRVVSPPGGLITLCEVDINGAYIQVRYGENSRFRIIFAHFRVSFDHFRERSSGGFEGS